MRLDCGRALNLLGDKKYGAMKRILARGGLSEHLRLVSSIASLQASGGWEELVAILNLAITDGDDLNVAYELLLQGYLFCGYPRAIESFFCLERALKGKCGLDSSGISPRSLESSSALLKRGATIGSKVHGDKFDRINNKISALCPDLGYLMIAEGYGHVLSREGLDIRTRELGVVASLTASGARRQLNSHIRGCRNVGCEDSEIYEAIFTCLLWISAERVVESLGLWSEITDEELSESVDNYIY
jgi:alkylhydroperoxidase/carboxymuconolactone decarboxylase family protein YurZ